MTAPSRFIGGEALAAVLEPHGLTLAEWNALAARGLTPAATYPYPQSARWRREDVLKVVQSLAPDTMTPDNETTND